MGNLKTLIDKIKKFYDSVETHDNQIREWVREADKPCKSLINQSILLRAVTPENSEVHTGFENRPGFKESLINSILNSLDKEYTILEEMRDKINEANETLYKEQKEIENLYVQLKSEGSIDYSQLNPCSPCLEHIITWCNDIWRYYHSFYLQIFQGLLNLEYENEESLNALLHAFQEDLDLKKPISRIQSLNLSAFEFFN